MRGVANQREGALEEHQDPGKKLRDGRCSATLFASCPWF